MIISLRPTEESKEKMGRILGRLMVFPDTLMGRAESICAEVYTEAIQSIFDEEGQPPWKPLAPMTQAERKLLFGEAAEAHPILRRPGEEYLFRSLWDTSFGVTTVMVRRGFLGKEGLSSPHASGHVRETIALDLGHLVFRMGTTDDRFDSLFEDRPFVPMGEYQTMICREMEARLMPVVDELARPKDA